MELGTADGHKDDVVLLPIRHHLVTHGGLDIGTGLAPLARRRHTVLGQDGVDLFVARIPDLFLAASDRVVFEEEVGLVGWHQHWGLYLI